MSGNTLENGVAIPNTFFEQYFSQEVQKLTFTGVVPGDVFALSVGSGVTGPITFGTTATTTALLIENQLDILLSGLGFGTGNLFTPAATVTGTQSGTTWTFTVTFGAGPNEPLIGYVGALSGVTFANSAAAPAANQQLTFSPAGAATALTNGLFTLKTTLGTSAADRLRRRSTADRQSRPRISRPLSPGSTVTVDPSSTATTFVFDVTFTTAKPVLQLAAANTLPPTSTYSAAITTPWNNADLLAYFNPFEGDAVGSTSTFTTAIYQARVGGRYHSIDSVDSAIDQVLYTAQYTPSVGIASANQEQLGRLRNILETVAGALRGESAAFCFPNSTPIRKIRKTPRFPTASSAPNGPARTSATISSSRPTFKAARSKFASRSTASRFKPRPQSTMASHRRQLPRCADRSAKRRQRPSPTH